MATLKFRGPRITGPAYERFRLLGFGDDAALEYCSNCKNCDISCPSGVPVAAFAMLARAVRSERRRPPLGEYLAGHAGTIGRLTRFLPAFMLNFGMKNPLSRALLDRAGLDRRAPLPSFAPLARRRSLTARRPARNAGTVVLFPGCFVRYYDPQVGLDIIRLLEKARYDVIVPENFVCCGLPLVTAGLRRAALARARANSRELARWADLGLPVITPCPSCALMLQREYGDLFPEEGELCRHGHIVSEACAFIRSLAEGGELSFAGARAPQTSLAYHAPCHLRAMGEGRLALDILRAVPGLRVEDMDAGCCGISGSYGLKKGKYEIGMAIGADLFSALRASGAGLAVSECGTCRVQMEHGAGLPAAHPLSVLSSCLPQGNRSERIAPGKHPKRKFQS
jgi:glycerol-3-phosphate dehydrogenase subunit C